MSTSDAHAPHAKCDLAIMAIDIIDSIVDIPKGASEVSTFGRLSHALGNWFNARNLGVKNLLIVQFLVVGEIWKLDGHFSLRAGNKPLNFFTMVVVPWLGKQLLNIIYSINFKYVYKLVIPLIEWNAI